MQYKHAYTTCLQTWPSPFSVCAHSMTNRIKNIWRHKKQWKEIAWFKEQKKNLPKQTHKWLLNAVTPHQAQVAHDLPFSSMFVWEKRLTLLSQTFLSIFCWARRMHFSKLKTGYKTNIFVMAKECCNHSCIKIINICTNGRAKKSNKCAD